MVTSFPEGETREPSYIFGRKEKNLQLFGLWMSRRAEVELSSKHGLLGAQSCFLMCLLDAEADELRVQALRERVSNFGHPAFVCLDQQVAAQSTPPASSTPTLRSTLNGEAVPLKRRCARTPNCGAIRGF